MSILLILLVFYLLAMMLLATLFYIKDIRNGNRLDNLQLSRSDTSSGINGAGSPIVDRRKSRIPKRLLH